MREEICQNSNDDGDDLKIHQQIQAEQRGKFALEQLEIKFQCGGGVFTLFHALAVAIHVKQLKLLFLLRVQNKAPFGVIVISSI